MEQISRSSRTVGAVAALAAVVLTACGDPQTDDGAIAFVNVNVVPMDANRVLTGQTVVVRDGRIAEMGPASSVDVPSNAVEVDGSGKYLMPGIAEMHGHVFTTDVITPEVAETFPELYVLTGVTTVRTMAGSPWQFELRDRIESGALIGPHIYTASPSLNGNSVNEVEHAHQLVREHHAAGYDLLKVHPGLSRAEYDAIVETAAELGIRVAGHVSKDVGIRRALEARQGVDHLDGYYIEAGADDATMAELARVTKEAGVYNAPTMDLWKTVLGVYQTEELSQRAELRYMLPALVEQWVTQTAGIVQNAVANRAEANRELAARDRMLKALHAAGAKLLLGSDSPQIFSVPGFSLTHELPAMVDAGVPTYAALEAATRNAAEYFGEEDEFGTVEVGKRADLILVEGNPLDDIRNVHRQAGVMVRGHWIPKSEIEERLERIATLVAR